MSGSWPSESGPSKWSTSDPQASTCTASVSFKLNAHAACRAGVQYYVERGRRAGHAISGASAVGATSASVVAAELRGLCVAARGVVNVDESAANFVDCCGARQSSALDAVVARRAVESASGGAKIGAEIGAEVSAVCCNVAAARRMVSFEARRLRTVRSVDARGA